MTFNKEYMNEKTKLFWDAYFKALEILDNNRGKYVEDVPKYRMVPIDDEWGFRIGRIRSVWELVQLKFFDDYEAGICVNELDDATRAAELLGEYVFNVV